MAGSCPAFCFPWDFKLRFTKSWAGLYHCGGMMTTELVTCSDHLIFAMRKRERQNTWRVKHKADKIREEENESWRGSHPRP